MDPDPARSRQLQEDQEAFPRPGSALYFKLVAADGTVLADLVQPVPAGVLQDQVAGARLEVPEGLLVAAVEVRVGPAAAVLAG